MILIKYIPRNQNDFEVHSKEINVLDTAVYKDFGGKLRTRIYRKPTDRQIFFHLKSEHPPALKKTIPYSQALRIRTTTRTITLKITVQNLQRPSSEGGTIRTLSMSKLGKWLLHLGAIF